MKVQKKCLVKNHKIIMDYFFQKCDTLSVTKCYDQHKEYHDKIINKFLSLENMTEQDVVNHYSRKYLGKMAEKYKDNKIIFDDSYHTDRQNQYREYDTMYAAHCHGNSSKKLFGEYHPLSSQEQDYRKGSIQSCISWLYYDKITSQWLKENKENIIFKKEKIISKWNFKEETYFLKLTKDLQKEILSKKSVYDWCYPKSIENVCLYKDGYCWFFSVAHEEICEMHCETEKEYEYLKSLGVKFIIDKFIPSNEDYIIYENYNDKN